MGTQGTNPVIRIKISGQTCPDFSNIFVNRWNAGASPLCYGSTVTDVRNMSPGEGGKKRGLASKLGYLYPSSSHIEVVPFKEYSWRYKGSIYEGDEFDKDKLSGTAVFEDGTEKELTEFFLEYAPAEFQGGVNEISISSGYGSGKVSLDAVRVLGIKMKGKKTIYEGKHSKKDFSYIVMYEDGSSRAVPTAEVSVSKIRLVSGKNHVTVSYNGKQYTVVIKARKKAAAKKAEAAAAESSAEK